MPYINEGSNHYYDEIQIDIEDESEAPVSRWQLMYGGGSKGKSDNFSLSTEMPREMRGRREGRMGDEGQGGQEQERDRSARLEGEDILDWIDRIKREVNFLNIL